jgi:hypothetical protein
LFIQVTWDGTEPPILQTVSDAGADDEGVDGALDELLELQPAMARAAAALSAAIAADVLLSPIAGSPSWGGERGRCNLGKPHERN